MYELIYFTIPGLLLVTGSFLWWQPAVSEGTTIALVSTSPVLGYALHQLYRIVFEWSGKRGHWRKRRLVIDEIAKTFSRGKRSFSREESFLIWELSIYDQKTSAYFLEHDARMWRFIISNWALAFVSFVMASVFLAVAMFDQSLSTLPLLKVLMLGTLLSLCVIFYIAGNQVFYLLNIQELAFFRSNKRLFQRTSASLARKR